jgi:hypothetical protein
VSDVANNDNSSNRRRACKSLTKLLIRSRNYPVAASLITLPFILGLGSSTPAAKWLAVVTGVAAIILTFFTGHKTGVIRILPLSFHVPADALVGIVFVTAPFVLGFTGLDAWYYW